MKNQNNQLKSKVEIVKSYWTETFQSMAHCICQQAFSQIQLTVNPKQHIKFMINKQDYIVLHQTPQLIISNTTELLAQNQKARHDDLCQAATPASSSSCFTLVM